MCHKIESTYILIHQLKNHESCTIKELVHKKLLIEKNNPTVFVDVSKNSILSAVNCFPEIFRWVGDEIMRKEDSNDFFLEPLIDYFDNNIKSSIKLDIANILNIA